MTWKREPQAWWPELPGRDMPGGWDATWKHHYENGKHYWEPGVGGTRPLRAVCKRCRHNRVSKIRDKYCAGCARKLGMNPKGFQSSHNEAFNGV